MQILQEIAKKRDEMGNRKFSKEEIEHFLPLMLINLLISDPEIEIGKRSKKLLENFFNKIDVHQEDDYDDLIEKVKEYYKSKPVHEELLNLVVSQLNFEIKKVMDEGIDRSSKLIARESKLQPLESSSEDDDQTNKIKAGPLAKFMLE